MIVKIKKQPEWSDNGEYLYVCEKTVLDVVRQYLRDNILNNNNIPVFYLYGSDVVSEIFKQPLSCCVGTFLFSDGCWFRANYKYSEQCEREGRPRAFSLVDKSKDALVLSDIPKELSSISDINNKIPCAFDIETGGKSGIRCVSFYQPGNSRYIDCRDLKSNKQKVKLLRDLFSCKDFMWIAHYGVHDVKHLCKALKISAFDLHADTIWFHREVEMRNLGYLAGVYLGGVMYKTDLDTANLTQDFEMLIRYCCMDSFYCYKLYENSVFRKVMRDSKLLNQVIHTMLNPPEFKLKNDIFKKYPELKGLSKSELKKKLTYVSPKDAQLLIKTANPPNVKISYHGLNGLSVVVPDELTYDGDLWMMSSTGYQDVDDIMASDTRFSSPEISGYRFKHNISPKQHFGVYDIEPSDIFLVNDVVCLSSKEKAGWKKVCFNDVRKLFYG